MSCSLKGCGFGRVQKKTMLKSLKSKKKLSRKIRTLKRISRKRFSRSRKTRSRKTRSRKTRKTRRSPTSQTIKFSRLSISNEIRCPKHKKTVKVVNMYKNGNTLLLSCGCKDERWKFFKTKKRNRSFGFKYLRNDQIIDKVFHSYPQNLTCGRA